MVSFQIQLKPLLHNAKEPVLSFFSIFIYDHHIYVMGTRILSSCRGGQIMYNLCYGLAHLYIAIIRRTIRPLPVER